MQNTDLVGFQTLYFLEKGTAPCQLYRSHFFRIEIKILHFTLKQNFPGSKKSADCPYQAFCIVNSELNRKAYATTTGASQPSAFNFLRYALILRSLLN